MFGNAQKQREIGDRIAELLRELVVIERARMAASTKPVGEAVGR